MTYTEGPNIERRETVVEGGIPLPDPVVPVVPVAPATPVVAGRARTDYAVRFAPDAVVTALVGLVSLLMGLIAVTRAGFDGPMSDPVVKVLGFRHTATLGLIEIGFGVALLLAGAMRSRSGAVFFGSLLGIAGFVAAVQTSSFESSLAIESAMAWLAVIAGVVVVLAALLMPRWAHRSTTISHV